MSRELFTTLKASCKTKGQMRAFNELVKSFGVTKLGDPSKDIDKILRIIKGKVSVSDYGYISRTLNMLKQFIVNSQRKSYSYNKKYINEYSLVRDLPDNINEIIKGSSFLSKLTSNEFNILGALITILLENRIIGNTKNIDGEKLKELSVIASIILIVEADLSNSYGSLVDDPIDAVNKNKDFYLSLSKDKKLLKSTIDYITKFKLKGDKSWYNYIVDFLSMIYEGEFDNYLK